MNIVITAVRPGDTITADRSDLLVETVETVQDGSLGTLVRAHGPITRGPFRGVQDTWSYTPQVHVDIPPTPKEDLPMNIETADWITIGEAAETLGVTHQRIHALGEEELLDIARPWNRVLLVGRESVEARLRGEEFDVRGPSRSGAFRWVSEQLAVKHVRRQDPEVVRDLVLDYVRHVRPRWDVRKQELWAIEMADELTRRCDGAPRERDIAHS